VVTRTYYALQDLAHPCESAASLVVLNAVLASAFDAAWGVGVLRLRRRLLV